MRWDVINALIEKHGLNSYLEIGYQNGICFDKVKCREKYSVDPNGKAAYNGTSDEFFAHIPKGRVFDLVFIDGLHHADQVERDILNSINLVKAKFVVVHDCLPTTEESQRVPRESKEWYGDVWRAWHGISNLYPNACELLNHDCGIGIIDIKLLTSIPEKFVNYEISFKEYHDSHSNTI